MNRTMPVQEKYTLTEDDFFGEPVQEKESFDDVNRNPRPGFPTHPRKNKSPGRFLARAKRK